MTKSGITMYDKRKAKELFTKGYRYLGRDEEGIVSAYEHKPYKHRMNNASPAMWASPTGNICECEPWLFKFVKWEDNEPTPIQSIM